MPEEQNTVVDNNVNGENTEPAEAPGLSELTTTTKAISELMSSVNTTITKVSECLTANPLYSMYIEFKVGGRTIVSTTTSHKNHDIAISLVNNKNGSGEANNFTLIIAHGPNFDAGFDANALENIITANTEVLAKSPERLKCTLRYGYSTPDIKTIEYTGLLLNYEVDCQDGILIYTLTGYTGLSRYTESKEPLSLKDICVVEPSSDAAPEDEENDHSDQPGTDDEQNSETEKSQTEDVAPEGSDTESEENSDDSENNSDVETPTVVSADRVKAQPTVAAQWVIHKYLPEYNCVFGMVDGSSVRGSDVSVEMSMQVDKNPMKALTDILNKAIHVSQREALQGASTIAAEGKITYQWFASDVLTNGKPTIYIIANNPSEEKKADAAFTFNWGDPSDGGMVISFKPKFNGSALMALWDIAQAKANAEPKTAGTEDTDENNTGESSVKDNEEIQDENAADATSQNAGTDEVTGLGSFFIKDDGSIGYAAETTSPAAGGSTEVVNANIEQLKSTWVSSVQYPYQATLTTLGIPCELPCTGIIQVNALVGWNSNKEIRAHHTSGKYMIQTTSDRIDGSGFTTEWKLLKVEQTCHEDMFKNTVQDDAEDTGENSGAKTQEELREEYRQEHGYVWSDEYVDKQIGAGSLGLNDLLMGGKRK